MIGEPEDTPRLGPEGPRQPGARYTILGELARGGLGRVFSASDDQLGRPVAIKLPIAPTAAARARFEREAKITSRLQHSGVVPVYDVGQSADGQPFFVMKLVEGRSLAELIRGAAAADARLALLGSVLSVAETLAYAHRHGIIHRDLKPANVVISDYGETVVIDWGLGRAVGEEVDLDRDLLDDPLLDGEEGHGLTQEGLVLGTPEFMPPEQAHGGPVDERADVYAIGAILFNVLAGEPPFSGDSKTAVLARVRTEAPPPLAGLIPRLPSDLVAIVAKAMARHPADRYSDAGELAEDLRRFLDGQLVRAHHYSFPGLAARWLLKHRTAVIVAVVLLAGSLTAGVLAARRIVIERNAALDARRTLESRENALVLQHAQRSVDDEPTAAVAWLKRHRSDPESAWLARMVAEEAVARGVARHVFFFAGPSPAAAVSATAPLLAVGRNDGSIRLHRLDTGGSGDLGRHPAAISDLGFCPGDFCLASLDVEGHLVLWGPDRHRRAEVTVAPSATGRLHFSADGARLVASAGQNGFVILNVSSPWQRRTFTLAERLASFAFCPGSGTLLVLDFKGRVMALAPEQTELVPVPGRHPDARLLCLPDGRFVSGGVDGEVKLWHGVRGLIRTLGRHRDWVTALAASPDGTHLGSASGDDTVMLHDLTGGGARILRGYEDTVRDLVFSGDGQILGAVAYDATLKIWQVQTGEPLATFRASRRQATRLRRTNDGRSLVVSGTEEARVWALPPVPSRVLRGHGDAIITLDWSPDGRLIAGGGRDNAARVWDAATGRSVGVAPLNGWVTLVRFSGNGRLLTSTRSARTSLFDTNTQRLEELVSPGPATAALSSVIVSADRRRLAYARDRRVWLRDITSGATVGLAGELPDVEDIAFTKDGAEVAVMSVSGALGFWRASDGGLVAQAQLRQRPSEFAVSPDGRWTAVRTALNRLILWDRVSDQVTELPADGLMVGRQAFTRDSREVAYTLADARIRLFDVVAKKSRTLRGHRNGITELVLSADRTTMASGDQAGFVRVWNLTTGGSTLLRSAPGPILRMAFSPDGQRLAVAGGDLTIQIWNLEQLVPSGDGSAAWLEAQTTAVVDDQGHLRTPSAHSATESR